MRPDSEVNEGEERAQACRARASLERERSRSGTSRARRWRQRARCSATRRARSSRGGARRTVGSDAGARGCGRGPRSTSAALGAGDGEDAADLGVALEREDDRQRRIAVAQVDAARLAGVGADRALDVEQIVAASGTPGRRAGRRPPSRRRRRAARRRGAPRCARRWRRATAVLRSDDLDVVVDGDGRVAAEAALQDLALGEADAGLGRPADHVGLEARAEREGAAEEEVAGDERVGEAERAEGRRPAAPRLAAVDDVVVQQRGRVDELERDRRLDGVVAAGAARPSAAACEDEQHDQRADALAARADEVRRDLLEPAARATSSSAASRSSTRARSSRTAAGMAGSAADDAASRERLSRTRPKSMRMPAPMSRTRTCVAFARYPLASCRRMADLTPERVREALRAVLFPGLPARRRDARHGDRRARRRRARSTVELRPGTDKTEVRGGAACAASTRWSGACPASTDVRVALAGADAGSRPRSVRRTRAASRACSTSSRWRARKGGVGKSTVAVNLALALAEIGQARRPRSTPTSTARACPIMLGHRRAPAGDGRASASVPVERYGIKAHVDGLLPRRALARDLARADRHGHRAAVPAGRRLGAARRSSSSTCRRARATRS